LAVGDMIRRVIDYDEAQALITTGVEFGYVYPFVHGDEDRAQLKDWFVHTATIPNLHARRQANTEVNGEGFCKCGGMLVRTGTCLTCQLCGESSGGCG
jgi:hypothetical protein